MTNTTAPNNTPSHTSYRPGGALSVQFGANDPDDTSPIQGSLPGSNHGSGRMTFANGVTTSERFETHSVQQADVIRDRVAGAGDSILATARTAWGTLGMPLTPKSVVSIGGLETSLAAAEQLGYVARNASGDYYETGLTVQGQQEQTQRQEQEQTSQAQEDAVIFNEQHLAKIDELIEKIPQQQYDATIASAISNGAESIDFNALADTLGTTHADAVARSEFIISSYRGQADAAVIPILGNAEDAAEDFYTWCETEYPREHQKALRSLLLAHSTADFKALAKQYMLHTSPDESTLKAGGFETKTEMGESFVKISGTWMTQRSAARAGFI